MSKNRFWQRLISLKSSLIIAACLAIIAFIGGQSAATFFPASDQSLDTAFLTCMDSKNILAVVGCIHEHSSFWVASYGASQTAHELDLYEQRFGSDFTCHLAGHEIGQAILNADHGSIGEAFGQCTSSCFSSCLHGVVIGYMASGTVTQLLALHPEELCAAPDIKDGYLLCLHGLGHAFMIGEAYHLGAALKDCDALQVLEPTKEQCYSGVYMELFFAADGLAHGEVASSTYSKPGDVFYPCDVAPTITNDGYARQCFIQVNALLDLYATAHKESAFSVCQSAPAPWQEACVIGIGLKQAGANSDVKKILTVCAEAPTAQIERQCLLGAYGYLRTGGTSAEVQAFCSAVPKNKDICDSSSSEDTAILNEVPPMAIP
jgi:hypothetical protein